VTGKLERTVGDMARDADTKAAGGGQSSAAKPKLQRVTLLTPLGYAKQVYRQSSDSSEAVAKLVQDKSAVAADRRRHRVRTGCAIDETAGTPAASRAVLRFTRVSTNRELLLKETAMSSTELPRHIVDRFERRWAKKLEQQARAWKGLRSESRSLTHQGIPVIRRVQRSRPPQKIT
jgi:hypothetical protein